MSMLEVTHRRLAGEIGKELNFQRQETALLEQGSVHPDSWISFPHHYGKEDEVVRHVLEARRLCIRNDDECFYKLGIALHMIQDKWTTRPRLGDKHTRWEEDIEKSELLDEPHLEEAVRGSPIPSSAIDAYINFMKTRLQSIGASEVEHYDLAFIAAISDLWRKEWPGEKPFKYDFGSVNGLGAKVVDYIARRRPATYSTPVIDLNLAFRLSLEVARKTCFPRFIEGRSSYLEDWKYEARLDQILTKFNLLSLTPREGQTTCPKCGSGLINSNETYDSFACRQCSFKWP